MGWIDEGIALFLIIISSMYIMIHSSDGETVNKFALGLLFFATLAYTKYKRKSQQTLPAGGGGIPYE